MFDRYNIYVGPPEPRRAGQRIKTAAAIIAAFATLALAVVGVLDWAGIRQSAPTAAPQHTKACPVPRAPLRQTANGTDRDQR